MEYKPHEYQIYSENFIIDNNFCALFLDMGLGKTVITLSAINRLLKTNEVSAVLIVAPLRVSSVVWPDELKKWNHLSGISFVCLVGGFKKAIEQIQEARKNNIQLYIINRELVVKLVEYLKNDWFFDMLVIDELSSFKSSTSKRFKALRRIRLLPVLKRVVGLTGTPAPNGLKDLWSQFFLIDKGLRLGPNKTYFEDKYFYKVGSYNSTYYTLYLKFGADKKIYSAISDICLSMHTTDYLTLPARTDNIIKIPMPEKIRKMYKDFEHQKVLELKMTEITAANAAALVNKLLQFCNGAVYDENNEYNLVHMLKIQALDELINSSSQNFLVFYNYRFDLELILKELAVYRPRILKTLKDVQDWNSGRIQLLLAHPASCGHGLNLQSGGNIIVWYGLTWSLELFQQANARLYRQGQVNAVIINYLILDISIEQDVIKALNQKNDVQNALIDSVCARLLT